MLDIAPSTARIYVCLCGRARVAFKYGSPKKRQAYHLPKKQSPKSRNAYKESDPKKFGAICMPNISV